MKPMENRNQVTTNMVGETVAMGIDTDALAHVMSILSGVYEDPALAVIREYATNALDSHAAAGETRPIEVELPTPLRPSLTIRDRGVGLSADEIRTVYSQYGASTKRGTNEAVGMLGIGCKSALAYTDQFTVAGVKDGERTLVSLTVNAEGAGEVLILSQEPTTEPNGVTVTVPVSDADAMIARARSFFRYWAPGTVIVDGEEPTRVIDAEDAFPVNDRFTLVPRDYGDDELTVVMGNVPYPALSSWRSDFVNAVRVAGFRIVASVDIGTVQFAPSREALLDHPQTRAALDGLVAELESAVRDYVTDKIERAESAPDAARALIALRGALGQAVPSDIEWRGRAIPLKLAPEGNHKLYSGQYKTYRPAGTAEAAREVTLDAAGKSLWILGYTNQKWTKAQRTKLFAYLEHEQGCDPEAIRTSDYMIYSDTRVPLSEWLDSNLETLDWEKVQRWRNPATAAARTPGRKVAGSYDLIYADGRSQTVSAQDLLSYRAPLYYMEGGRNDTHRAIRGIEYLGKGAVAVMAGGRIEKFKRLYPRAKRLHDATRRKAEGVWSRVSPERRQAFADAQEIRGYVEGRLNELTEMRVTLPDALERAARLHRETQRDACAWDAYLEFVRAADRQDDTLPEPALDIEAAYPLIFSPYVTLRGNEEHVQLYLDAVNNRTEVESE